MARALPSEPSADDLSPPRGSFYRAWAQLLQRSFEVSVLECPKCQGRMKLVALVIEPKSVARYLAKLGEPIDIPARSTSRGPPYWKSTFCVERPGRDSKRMTSEHSEGARATRFA